MPSFRDLTRDAEIWESVYTLNEYGLARRLGVEDVVVDIGAHIGAFALRAAEAGAGTVLAVEPDIESFTYLKENVGRHPSLRLFNRAVWHLAGPHVVCAIPTQLHNTGGFALDRDGWQERGEVAAITFDDLVDDWPAIRLLKLDCEGAEWPILQTAKRIDRVQCIVGEYHVCHRSTFEDISPIFCDAYDKVWLKHLLIAKWGFEAKIDDANEEGLGHFRAWRPGKEVW